MQQACLSADAMVKGEREANRLNGEEGVMDRVENEGKEGRRELWLGGGEKRGVPRGRKIF